MKVCTKCDEEKELIDFHKHKMSKDGYRTICKECRKPADRLYYTENSPHIKQRVKKFREKNKNYLITNKKYRENNKEFVNILKKEWSKSESGKISRKKYYEKNSDIIIEKVKENRESKKEKYKEKSKIRRGNPEYKEKMKTYIKKHREKNPHIYAWRSILTNTLKRLNTKKSDSTIKMMGYSAEDLKIHLESLFKEGMSWENYGEWHIDHIKPVSLFGECEDVKIVNALENLQPLWANENLSKYNHYN